MECSCILCDIRRVTVDHLMSQTRSRWCPVLRTFQMMMNCLLRQYSASIESLIVDQWNILDHWNSQEQYSTQHQQMMCMVKNFANFLCKTFAEHIYLALQASYGSYAGVFVLKKYPNHCCCLKSKQICLMSKDDGHG